MDWMLRDKIVLLTGATGGIGRQICADFLQAGTHVFAVHRDDQKVSELKDWILQTGNQISSLTSIKADILNKEQIRHCVNEALMLFGRLDILINCAGYSLESPFAMLNEEQILDMVNVNLLSPMLFSQAVLKPMFKQRSGSIINISTFVANKRGRGVSVYASAKAGLDSFTRSLAQEVGKFNIRVNSIRPGMVETDMTDPLRERFGSHLVSSTALNRAGRPEDVSSAALFLASDRTASFITGAHLHVDGGLYL